MISFSKRLRVPGLVAVLFYAGVGAMEAQDPEEHRGHAAVDTLHAGAEAHAAHSPGAHAEHDQPAHRDQAGHGHSMFMLPLGGGWSMMGMAQAFPTYTVGAPDADGLLSEGAAYLTQPAAMFNIESPRSRVVLRTTLNFEAWTLADGELTLGGWGEGFIDRRHPHTLLHELMLSANLWEVGETAMSLSLGKGFAPYGTDDPMARPVLKYPTNHHLSQILERWTVNGIFLWRGWSFEAGIFGGAEPTDPYDLSNIESFGDSWSIRTAQRFGAGSGPNAEWEVSGSYARIEEAHHGDPAATILRNLAVRYDSRREWGRVYGLVEVSDSHLDGEDDETYFSILGEALIGLGAHQPYARVEYATRPEYAREAASGEGFFRYDHDAHPIGATRWLIPAIGYGYTLTGYPFSVRPFAEAQYHRVDGERGGIDPRTLFGDDRFWSFSFGARIFIGGEPMRMGAYGILDPISTMRESH